MPVHGTQTWSRHVKAGHLFLVFVQLLFQCFFLYLGDSFLSK